jgi:hypothetical protein
VQSSRLVTLTGAGGCGKTRLSVQLAAGLLDEYGDGVWLVELAAVTDEDAVAPAIHEALRLAAQPQSADPGAFHWPPSGPGSRSITVIWCPRRASAMAVYSPVGPAPTISERMKDPSFPMWRQR